MIVVTRHRGLVVWLEKNGYIPPNTKVLDHAIREDIEGEDVIGVLPISLAVYAKTYTEVPLWIPPSLRGVDLSADQVEKYQVGEPVTYKITKVE